MKPNTTPCSPAEKSLIALLALCAVTLGGLLANGLAAGTPANADIVSTAGGSTTILSTEVSNEDLILILDSRTEELLAYRTDVQKGVQLVQRLNVPTVFADARGRGSSPNR